MKWLLPSLLTCLMVAQSAAYIAQVRIYIDKEGETAWKKILKKTEQKGLELATAVLFDEMNVLLQGLKPEVDMQLQLKDVVFLNRNILAASKTRDGKLQIAQSSVAYSFYTHTQYTYKKEDYDLTMLFTGVDIVNPNYPSKGASYLGQVCLHFGVGVTEVLKPELMTLMTLHEIAHILGAKHDGRKNCRSGSYSKGNLMSVRLKQQNPNRFKFSQCSKIAIRDLMYKLESEWKNCLRDGNLPRSTHDDVCQRLKGDTWGLARGKYGHNSGDATCSELKCVALINGKFEYANHVMPDRIGCGTNKRCVNKKCVQMAGGSPQIPDVCPWGDQNLSLWGYKNTCSTRSCTSSWKKWCCKKCP